MARPRIAKHLDAAHLMRCPLCGGSLEAVEPSLRCKRGHSFVVSSKGFVTFVGNCAPLKGYDIAFFESRARVMAAGFYNPVIEAVASAAASITVSGPIIDAGCGEGTYAKKLSSGPRTVIGLDYSKDAIRCAARGANDTLWLVADLANMPIADHSASCIANVFTPANYSEFKRVLAPDGAVIKVIPGASHMQELRQLAKGQLRHVDYSNDNIVEHFARHVEIVSRTRVSHTQTVRDSQIEDVIRMSPVSFDLEDRDAIIRKLDQITVDAEILVGKFAG